MWCTITVQSFVVVASLVVGLVGGQNDPPSLLGTNVSESVSLTLVIRFLRVKIDNNMKLLIVLMIPSKIG